MELLLILMLQKIPVLLVKYFDNFHANLLTLALKVLQQPLSLEANQYHYNKVLELFSSTLSQGLKY